MYQRGREFHADRATGSRGERRGAGPQSTECEGAGAHRQAIDRQRAASRVAQSRELYRAGSVDSLVPEIK